MAPLVTFVMLMLFVVLFGYGGMRVASGAITAGQLVAFMLYLFQIVMPITQITQFFNQSQKQWEQRIRFSKSLIMKKRIRMQECL